MLDSNLIVLKISLLLKEKGKLKEFLNINIWKIENYYGMVLKVTI